MPTAKRLSAKPYLIDVTLLRDRVTSFDEYPFSVPAVKNLGTLEFHPDVTFFVGENGTGKSTLMEALALLERYNPEGGTRNSLFATHETHSVLHEYLKASKSYKMPKDGYFLRSETFYNFATYIDEVDYAASYGGSLHTQSHGESILSLLTHKFRGNGLYLLDEPEAALSPSRQLSALAVIHRLVRRDSQFIIATHSPMLMAYPGARIYLFSDSEIRETAYEETEHYQIARDFFRSREQMLEVLFADE